MLVCLIIFVFVFGISLGLVSASYYHRLKVKNESLKDKKFYTSMLGLTASHLHDAGNFFGLIKSSLDKEHAENSYNFAKGAAFHFRSIFEELKSKIEKLASTDSEIDSIDLYAKESIDLKDLLELELFQISNFTRVRFMDLVESQHSIVLGNFSLLSKALINLIENALKYTNGEIKIELKDSNQFWLIKVNSFGKDLPIEIENQLTQEGSAHSLGHGLSSLREIVKFHDGKIEVSSFAGEGSSISLYLPKIKFKEQNLELISKKPEQIFKRPYGPILAKLSLSLTLIAIIILIVRVPEVFIKEGPSQNPLKITNPTKIISKPQALVTTKPLKPGTSSDTNTNSQEEPGNQDLSSAINSQDQDLGLSFEF